MSQKKQSKKIDLNELKAKCDQYLQGWQRAQADYQNLQKETAKAKQEWIKFANADLLMELLPVYDNLKLALNHIPKEQRKSDWVVGIEHIKNQFNSFLRNAGIEEVKTVGKKFDPLIHESMKALKHENKRDETHNKEVDGREQVIKQEIRPGYKLNGKVLYPAKVVVQ